MTFSAFDKIGRSEWDEFCENSDSAWLRHTSHWIEFCLALNESNENLSFGVFEDGEMLAVVPLVKQPISGADGFYEFLTAGTPVAYPALKNGLADSKKNELIKAIFSEIDDVAARNSVAYSRFFIDPLTPESLSAESERNLLSDLGFDDVSLTTNIVNLSEDEAALFRNIRKGFRYDIRSMTKSGATVDFFDGKKITEDIFRKYKEIYFSAAGKEVGTKERWTATLKLIRLGYAVLAMESKEGEYISGAIFFTYKRVAYYAFGATASSFRHVNGVSHLLQWEVIKYLKINNFNFYELGWNFNKNISDEVYSPKELNISFFKSGFGGKISPLFRGEKFYDEGYFKIRKEELAKKFTEINTPNAAL